MCRDKDEDVREKCGPSSGVQGGPGERSGKMENGWWGEAARASRDANA